MQRRVAGTDHLDFYPTPPWATRALCEWIVTSRRHPDLSDLTAWDPACAERGVALLVRTAFLEGVGRLSRLFAPEPPTDIFQFSERVVMHHGHLSKEGSTATAYCWVVWRKPLKGCVGTHFHWIAPCRKRLERDSDYPIDDAPPQAYLRGCSIGKVAREASHRLRPGLIQARGSFANE